MIKYIGLILAVAALGVACKTKKNTTSNGNSVKADSTVVNVSDSIRLNVSFISPGDGINGDALKKLVRHIELFEGNNDLKLTYYKIPWGREGEVDFCFKLSTIDSKKAKEFVTGVKNLIGSAEKVIIKENCNCKNVPQR